MRNRAIMTVVITLAVAALAATAAWRLKPMEHSLSAPDEHAHEEEGHDAGDDKHADEIHDEHEGEDIVRLSKAEMEEFGIKLDIAGAGKLRIYVSLPGEIVINADRLAHIVPRVGGVVREVRKTLGEQVRAHEVMAVVESRELADAKSAFLAARERVGLAEVEFQREQTLWEKKISAQKNYLRAKKYLAEAGIGLRSAEQKLHALGFTDDYLTQLPEHPDISFTRYEITAPFDGTVIEKHVTLGEAVKDDALLFSVADLSFVWVDLSVYPKDLPFVRKGQRVLITAGHGVPDVNGRISYVGPLVGEQTRTALARIVLRNKDGKWRPGLFVTGKIATNEIEVPLLVPKTALQTVEGRLSVFVETEEGFEPQQIKTGKKDETHVEITSGLESGQRYVTKGAFTLKAQLSKGAFGDGHGH